MGRARRGGGDAGGGKSGAKGSVEYTRIIPRFLQDISSTHAPSGNDLPVKENPCPLKLDEQVAALSEAESAERELNELREAGFNVDTTEMPKLYSDNGKCNSVELEISVRKSRHGDNVAGVSTSRIQKTRTQRPLPKKSKFSSQNNATLSFMQDDDNGGESSGG